MIQPTTATLMGLLPFSFCESFPVLHQPQQQQQTTTAAATTTSTTTAVVGVLPFASKIVCIDTACLTITITSTTKVVVARGAATATATATALSSRLRAVSNAVSVAELQL